MSTTAPQSSGGLKGDVPAPAISVIVPVYKAEKYLRKCVDSLLAQTFTDFEVLLVDDGSPDRSGEICDRYAARDPRVRVFHKENGGVSSARNLGIEQARGKWLVFVDSDDWCESEYLASFFEPMPESDGMFVIQGRANDSTCGCRSEVRMKAGLYEMDEMGSCVLDNDLLAFGAPYCKLFSKNVIQKLGLTFPLEYSYGEDSSFFFRYLSAISSIRLIDACKYHYMAIPEESLSTKNHDFASLSAFITDSSVEVQALDERLGSSGRLIACYTKSCSSLLLRAIVNMYRLGYGRQKRLGCFRMTRSNLLRLECLKTYKVMWMKYIPSLCCDFIFHLIMLFRK